MAQNAGFAISNKLMQLWHYSVQEDIIVSRGNCTPGSRIATPVPHYCVSLPRVIVLDMQTCAKVIRKHSYIVHLNTLHATIMTS